MSSIDMGLDYDSTVMLTHCTICRS